MSQLSLNGSVSVAESVVVEGAARPTWSATVWVKDFKRFSEALEWKYDDTMSRWASYEAYYDSLDEAAAGSN